MNKFNLPLFLSLIIFLATTIIVGIFGVVPLPEYGNITSNMKFEGKIIYRVEIESQNLIPPAPDIMDECIFSVNLTNNSLIEEKIICTSDLEYDLGYNISFFDAQLYEERDILIRYWDEFTNSEMGLVVDINSGEILDKIKNPNFPQESDKMNVYGEKLIDPWETSDYDSRIISIYYQTRYESIEVYSSKAPTNYRFESLKWSPDGNTIVGIDTEHNLLLFSKDREFDPVIVEFKELNLELENFEEKRILNLLGWTN